MSSSRHLSRYAVAAAGLALAVVPIGCSRDSGGDEAGVTAETLTVFAAASLTEVFDELEARYENDHPEVDVVISFGSSTALAEQVQAGAPADVIATADEKSIGLVADAGLLDGQPELFATNTLALVTPPDDPAGISGLDDLAGAVFVVCDPSAPCGAAARTVLSRSGVSAEPASYEEDVKAVLTKVTLGEADAGLVYVTDARAAGQQVTTHELDRAVNVVNPYLLGLVKESPQASAAADWIELVTSSAGRRVLREAGFGLP